MGLLVTFQLMKIKHIVLTLKIREKKVLYYLLYEKLPIKDEAKKYRKQKWKNMAQFMLMNKIF